MEDDPLSFPQTPEALLAEGLQAHIDGDFEDAICLRERAATMLGTADPRYPGVQGTIALAYDRLNRHEEAVGVARSAYDMLYRRLQSGTTSAQQEILLTERPTVELHLGIVLARATAKLMLQNQPYDRKQYSVVSKMFEAAHIHQQELRAQQAQESTKSRIHQWDINLLRRRAGAIAMDPASPKLKGIQLGLHAMVKGVISESSHFVDGTSGIDGPQKYRKLLRAKSKAVLGGMAATAQCVLALSDSKISQRARAKIAASRAVF